VNSEDVWNARYQEPVPTVGYRLPSPFHPLERVPSLPWHFQHSECEDNARCAATTVPSFILRIDLDGRTTLIPMEETLLARCGICSIMRKILPCLQGNRPTGWAPCLEFKRNVPGKRESVVIDAAHGLIAHSVLIDFLKALEAGEIVDVKLT
jgi:hypothetical protein